MMKAKFLILIVALVPFTVSLEAGFWDKLKGAFSGKTKEAEQETLMRVLIVDDQPGIVLEITGRHQIVDPNNGSVISNRLHAKRRIMQPISEGLKWGEEFPGVYQIKISPLEDDVKMIVDGIPYSGPIYVYNVDGRINVVAESDLEGYLKTILASRYQDPLPKEAYAALAITSRTTAYYQAHQKQNKFWDVRATDVGYKGLNAPQPQDQLAQALNQTKGMILSKKATKNDTGLTAAFPAQWGAEARRNNTDEQGTNSQITVQEVEDLADAGEDASKILKKAFPETSVKIVK